MEFQDKMAAECRCNLTAGCVIPMHLASQPGILSHLPDYDEIPARMLQGCIHEICFAMAVFVNVNDIGAFLHFGKVVNVEE